MARRQTTGRGLSADRAFVGLVDYGLFSEKLPPCFTSEGLSTYVPQELLSLTETDDSLKDILKKGQHDFIRYESLRATNISRQIGIPHPESYILQCLALKWYWTKIKEYCAKPKPPVSRIFVRKTSSKRIFRMNYEGRERSENEEATIHNMMGAHYVAHTDISQCFPSIYTHSIPWAMHGRSESKKDRSLLLPGNLIDRATQGTRDGQTNGLLIGPHTSNVISEIILTRIDKMVQRKYEQFSRYIDDYTFYAKTHAEAESFIRELGIQLREYELALNEKKTKILPMPLQIESNWVRELKRFQWPAQDKIVRFGTVRSFLDLSLELAQRADTYAVLYYAIKMVPSRLDTRGKRLFVQQSINLALRYPYLAPILDRHVFGEHHYDGIENVILEFIEELLKIGIQRIYSDAIAHALYYSLKYDLRFGTMENRLGDVIEINDCLSDVLLLEYAERHKIRDIREKLKRRTEKLKGMENREKDRFWLLIYQIWNVEKLEDQNQRFLADLKRKRFKFVRF